MRTHFFTGNWSYASLQEAIKKIKSEKALCFYWKKLLREIHIPESQVKLSTDVLSAFVRKFSKRRCVTYLAKDGLSPLHEEDESAIRQMLKKFVKTDEQKKAETNAGTTDICFRCHKQGHWAKDCLEGHEEEWLTKQKCFQCGQQGHLKSGCPKKIEHQKNHKTTIMKNKPPTVKKTWYHAGISLPRLLSTLSQKSLDYFKCYKPISSTASNDPKYFKQRSTPWFEARKGIINASKAATALGWYGKKAMTDYWNQLSNDLHGSQNEAVDHESNLAMLWGSMNEHSPLVTYLKKFFSQSKHGATVKETGIWFLKDNNNQNWLGSSPDGIIEEKGKLTTVLEMKCPFMGGKPAPYQKVCVNHIPQIMLQMCCTSTQQCHYMTCTLYGHLLVLKCSLLREMINIWNYF